MGGLAKHAPKVVTTVRAYLDELANTMAPGSVVSYESHLRDFVTWLLESDPTCRRSLRSPPITSPTTELGCKPGPHASTTGR